VVFDGLSEGQYTLTVYAPGYPAEKRAVAGPQKVAIDRRGCVIEILLSSGTTGKLPPF
jgi:hypothetical protein